jgi:hypothetical protein
LGVEGNPVNTESNEKKYGLVILLDALGVSALGIDDAVLFAKSRDELLSSVNFWSDNSSSHSAQASAPTRDSVFTFGDTILITFPIAKTDYLPNFERCMEWLCGFFCNALNKQIYLRGAVSLGDYYADDKTNTVIGPAVSEAAAWYEKHDWMGIVATPSLTVQAMLGASYIFRGEGFGTKAQESTFSWLSPYSAPTKKLQNSSHDHDLLVLDWPRWGIRRGSMVGTMFNPSLCFYRAIRQKTIPFGTESKYLNTSKFVEWSTFHCALPNGSFPRDSFAKRIAFQHA